MKMKRFLALLLTAAMAFSGHCLRRRKRRLRGRRREQPRTMGYYADTGETLLGPVYDEWSDMTDDELYEWPRMRAAPSRYTPPPPRC